MTTGRYLRHPSPTGARRSTRQNNFFLAMIGSSLAVHIIVALLLFHNPTTATHHRPPTVYVDLVMAPVANPQRGSAGVAKTTATPVAPQKAPPQPLKVAKNAVVLKGKISKSAVEKDDDISADIAKIRKKIESDEIAADIAAMRKKTLPTPHEVAVAGSPTGSGDEAGSALGEWLQKTVKEKWNWPGRKRKDLSAEVEVEFDKTGKLSGYRLIRPSSDPRFDDSLKRALFSLEPLPKSLRKPFKETILFNLNDLQGQ